MSGFKGTPGPWRVDPSHCADVQTLDGQWEVASTSPFVLTGGKCPDEWRANARLIAAAPELLGLHEADMVDLDLLAKAIHAGDPMPELVIRVTDMLNRKRAAIAKATGEQP